MLLRILIIFLFYVILGLEAKNKREIKVLVLVICSDNLDVYKYFQKSWRSYMHLDCRHFECYFIRGDKNLPAPFLIENDVIWSKTQEAYIPGILNKTLLSLEGMSSRLGNFDYVLRANLSAFFVFPRLLKFLKELPEREVYCGISHEYFPHIWVNGSGIILSTDLAKMLVAHKGELMNLSSDQWCHIDDVVIGDFFKKQGIGIIPSKFLELYSPENWDLIKNDFPQDVFHFRIRFLSPDNQRLSDLEIESHKVLLNHFYKNRFKVNR